MRYSTPVMSFDFLVETYETERVKILSVWTEFRDEDLADGRAGATRADAACTNRWSISA